MLPPVYRLPIPAKPERRAATRRTVDGTAVAALVVLGLVSAIRVMGAIVRHDVFGGECTLALLCLLTLPWIAWPAATTCASPPEAHAQDDHERFEP